MPFSDVQKIEDDMLIVMIRKKKYWPAKSGSKSRNSAPAVLCIIFLYFEGMLEEILARLLHFKGDS